MVVSKYLKFGSFRITIITPIVVFKIPRIRLVSAISSLIHAFRYAIKPYGKRSRWAYFSLHWRASIKDDLFSGMIDNWREFTFFWTTRHRLLKPTYVSFVGFLNISRYGKDYPYDETDLWCQLHEITNGEVHKDGHHFSNSENFSIEGLELRIRDYGSINTQAVLSQWGDDILKKFNPDYVRPWAKSQGTTS